MNGDKKGCNTCRQRPDGTVHWSAGSGMVFVTSICVTIKQLILIQTNNKQNNTPNHKQQHICNLLLCSRHLKNGGGALSVTPVVRP